MLAFIFIRQGYETFRRPENYAQRAELVVRPLAERVPAVPGRVEDAVRINGAVQLAAGSLLALGRLPRPAAFMLAATLIPTTLAGHRFWEEQDDAARQPAAHPPPQEPVDARRPRSGMAGAIYAR
jgi:putative oxidoreductase